MGKFTFRGYYTSQDQIPEPVSFLTGANLARPFATQGPRCPACGGELVALGNLGAVAWSRCRDCGIITGANLRRDDPPPGPDAGAGPPPAGAPVPLPPPAIVALADALGAPVEQLMRGVAASPRRRKKGK